MILFIVMVLLVLIVLVLLNIDAVNALQEDMDVVWVVLHEMKKKKISCENCLYLTEPGGEECKKCRRRDL